MADFEFNSYKYGTGISSLFHEGETKVWQVSATVTPGTVWEDAANFIKILKDIPADIVPLNITVENADFDDGADLDITLRANDGTATFGISATGATTFQAAANTKFSLLGGASSGDAVFADGDDVADWVATITAPWDLEVDITTAAGAAAGNAGVLQLTIEVMRVQRDLGTPLNADIVDGQA